MDFPDPLPLATPPGSAAARTVASELSVTDREATRQAREQNVGQRPGTLRVKAGALKPRLFLFSYNEQGYTETEYTDRYDELLAAVHGKPELKHWLDVRGYGDLPLMERFMNDFGLHPLQLEDVLGDYQRAKVEVFDEDRLFLVSRMTDFTADLEINDDQLSIFTGPNYVLCFQDDYDDCLEVLRNRLRTTPS
ncbi:MAG: CorA family divalent cation transporter, partial [Janthinobacterium lividum]